MKRLRKGKEKAKANVASSLACLCLPEAAPTLVILQSGCHHPGLEPHPTAFTAQAAIHDLGRIGQRT